jgi:hypothetical protein
VRTLQEVQDIFLEIRSGVDFGFVQERSRAPGFDLAGNLLGHPCVGATMADEHQSALSTRILFHCYNDTTPILPI